MDYERYDFLVWDEVSEFTTEQWEKALASPSVQRFLADQRAKIDAEILAELQRRLDK